MNELIEYIKLHIISLEQDLDKLSPYIPNLGVEKDISFIQGELEASRHFLSVATDIMAQTERK